MSNGEFAESLFELFCAANGVPCERVPTGRSPAPDFIAAFGGCRVTCEVKQIDMNDVDLQDLQTLQEEGASGRYVVNRLRDKLKHVSSQLKAASRLGTATLLVIYDNTPFKSYSDHGEVVQAMFGRNSVVVSVPEDPSLPTQVSQPFFAGDRGVGPRHNTALSAIAVLDGGPHPPLRLRVYHNPFAAVRLDPGVFATLPVSQPVRPDTREVEL
jgi:hypothetical protein